MTIRLSMSNLAGIARTLVAVGTPRLASMFATVRAAAPRSLDVWAPAGGGVAGAGLAAGALGAAVVPGTAGALGAAEVLGDTVAGATVPNVAGATVPNAAASSCGS